jgi:hypothetical protein
MCNSTRVLLIASSVATGIGSCFVVEPADSTVARLTGSNAGEASPGPMELTAQQDHQKMMEAEVRVIRYSPPITGKTWRERMVRGVESGSDERGGRNGWWEVASCSPQDENMDALNGLFNWWNMKNTGGSSPNKSGRPWGWLVLSVICFGLLLAFRSEIHSIWLRALVAGIAFAFLIPVVRQFQKNEHWIRYQKGKTSGGLKWAGLLSFRPSRVRERGERRGTDFMAA